MTTKEYASRICIKLGCDNPIIPINIIPLLNQFKQEIVAKCLDQAIEVTKNHEPERRLPMIGYASEDLIDLKHSIVID